MCARWMLGLSIVSQMSCERVLGLDGPHVRLKFALASMKGVGRMGARCLSLRGGGVASPRMVRLEGKSCMHPSYCRLLDLCCVYQPGVCKLYTFQHAVLHFAAYVFLLANIMRMCACLDLPRR